MAVTPEDMQVAARPQRRSFTAEYKRRILKEADACHARGGRSRGSGARAAQSAPAPRVLEAGTARHRPQPGLELGHYQAPGPGEVNLLLSLRAARHLQPLRRRLAAGPPGGGRPGQGFHRRELRAAAHRPRLARHPCRPRPLDDVPACGPAPGHPRDRALAQPAAGVGRQPLLRGPVQNPQEPARCPSPVRGLR